MRGFDPTAPSLHAGHLVPLLTLRRFQQAGHRPIVLAGGATGLIGDPRETGERVLNTDETVQEWTGRIRGQLERFVDFDSSPTGAIVENNLEWTSAMSAIELLRDVGKHFSVNVMLDRDTIRRRLEGEGISYTEFSYMLLQANDYVELHRRHQCVLQIGGSDQWGNIIAGVRLVRQKLAASVHALTVPLVTSADGTKFGKSTGGGNLWLDPEMTTPVCLVPVLRQHRRCRRHPVPALVHLPVGRRAGRTGGGHRGTAARACGATPAGARTHHPRARRARHRGRRTRERRRCSVAGNWPGWTSPR